MGLVGLVGRLCCNYLEWNGLGSAWVRGNGGLGRGHTLIETRVCKRLEYGWVAVEIPLADTDAMRPEKFSFVLVAVEVEVGDRGV